MKVPSSGVAIETTGARVGAHSTALPTLKASALETKASMLAKVGKPPRSRRKRFLSVTAALPGD
jgi:hypothetical protein